MAPSGIEGQGLFARVAIPVGVNMVEYAGPRLSADEGRRKAKDGNVYIFQANRREAIDGSVLWNLGRYANHGCAPNAKSVSVDGGIWLRALRPIARGEEITYDYGYSFRDPPSACSCTASNCRGIIA
jgi:SET domain-containing protein